MRDQSKYIFQGLTMGKAPLVRALVKRYVLENPSITFDKLRAVFPDSLQTENSTGQFARARCVVMRLADVPQEYSHRFDEQVPLADGIVAISREWNIGNIQNVLAKARELGYEVIPE